MRSADVPTVVSIPSPAATSHGTSRPPSSIAGAVKRETSEAGHGSVLQIFQRGSRGYKLWILVAILVLAFWSMFTGSLTLKCTTTGYLTRYSDKLDLPVDEDLDALEVEEKKKVVRHMWDLYAHGNGGYGSNNRLPRFWQEAFKAAYEDLASDIGSIRDAAISEIAKLSVRSLHLYPLSLDHHDDHSSTPSKTNQNSGSRRQVKSMKKV